MVFAYVIGAVFGDSGDETESLLLLSIWILIYNLQCLIGCYDIPRKSNLLKIVHSSFKTSCDGIPSLLVHVVRKINVVNWYIAASLQTLECRQLF